MRLAFHISLARCRGCAAGRGPERRIGRRSHLLIHFERPPAAGRSRATGRARTADDVFHVEDSDVWEN
eukprot:6689628-Prymnesium_polylepis.1